MPAVELKRLLFDAIRPKLQADGFVLKRTANGFVRRYPDRTEKFSLVFVQAVKGFSVRPWVAVRFDEVEAIYHQVADVQKEFQGDSVTFGSGVGQLMGGSNRACEFELDAETDLPVLAEKISQVCLGFGVSYFAKYASLKEIDAALNENPRAHNSNRGMTWLRCATGVIVAKLVERPGFERLCEAYTEEMVRTNKGPYLQRFRTLIDLLGKR